MRKFLLISFLLASCGREEIPSVETVYVEDTSKLVLIKNFIQLQKELGNTYSPDVTVQQELENKSRIIDTLIQKSLDFKESKIDIFILQNKYNDLVAEKVVLIEQGKAIQQENESLKLNNISLKKALDAEKSLTSRLTGENKQLYKTVLTASDVIISNVKVKGYGYNKSLFSGTKKIYTDKADKIKGFEVDFIFPKNDLATSETKGVNISIYSTDRRRSAIKDTIVNYEGVELPISMRIPVDNLAVGSHDLIIYINDEKQYSSSYTIVP